jgi:hypothetical protein
MIDLYYTLRLIFPSVPMYLSSQSPLELALITLVTYPYSKRKQHMTPSRNLTCTLNENLEEKLAIQLNKIQHELYCLKTMMCA